MVPAYTFGETSTFWTLPGWQKFKERAADLGVPAIILTGTQLLCSYALIESSNIIVPIAVMRTTL